MKGHQGPSPPISVCFFSPNTYLDMRASFLSGERITAKEKTPYSRRVQARSCPPFWALGLASRLGILVSCLRGTLGGLEACEERIPRYMAPRRPGTAPHPVRLANSRLYLMHSCSDEVQKHGLLKVPLGYLLVPAGVGGTKTSWLTVSLTVGIPAHGHSCARITFRNRGVSLCSLMRREPFPQCRTVTNRPLQVETLDVSSPGPSLNSRHTKLIPRPKQTLTFPCRA